jgi:alpha-amylase
VPKDSVSFHMERGDFAGWIHGVLGDRKLADSIEGAATRYDLIRLIRERRLALWSHLQ